MSSLRVCAVLIFLALLCTDDGVAQSRFFLGGGGGFGGGYPSENEGCDSNDQLAAVVAVIGGVETKRAALIADFSLIASGGGDDCVFLAETAQQDLDVTYPLRPLTLSARLDLFGGPEWISYVRGGGGIMLGTDIPVLTLGAGAHRRQGNPSVSIELSYSRFEYERNVFGSAPPPKGTANPIALRFLVSWY